MFSEIFEYSQQSYLALWSVMMLIVAVLTIISLFTGFDADASGVDVDGDGHLEPEGFLHSFFVFFNIGRTPITIVIFCFVALNWSIGMALNTTLNRGHNIFVGWILFFVIIFLSLPVLKVMIIPFKKFYGALLEDEELQTKAIGSICVTQSEVTSSSGQAMIKDGPTVVNLMVMCAEGESIAQGKEAVVIEKDEQKNRYLISELQNNTFN